jgi:RTX calcium-binding nonapeptide repeat (4 copies)
LFHPVLRLSYEVTREVHRGLVSLAVLVVLCAVAAPAAASTAQLVDVVLPPYCKYNPPNVPCLPGSAKALVYRAGAGEANRVSLTGTREELRIGDPAAVIEPGPGCSRIDHHSVRCSAPEIGIDRVYIATASGADTVRSKLDTIGAGYYGEVLVDGGHGNDRLVGGAGRDRLYGGKGDDVLRGRGGDDQLFDASPQRTLRSGDPSPFEIDEGVHSHALVDPGPGRDSFDGGDGGGDRVSYAARSAGVRVDLANTAAIGGARGERDSVRGVEGTVGGAGNDRLAGNRRNNELDGGAGDDRIVGRHGADFIEAGSGRNVVVAGPGDDQINAHYRSSDEGADRFFCGTGRDSPSWLFPSDFVSDDCESLGFNFLGAQGLFGGGAESLLPLRAGYAPFVLSAPELWCYFVANPSGCRLTLALRVDGPAARGGTAPVRGTLLGSQSYTFSPDERKGVLLRLSPGGLETLRRHGALRVRVTASEGGGQPSAGYLTVLRAP